MKLKMLLIFCFILCVTAGKCQEKNLNNDPAGLKKNAFYGTVGFFPDGLYSTVMGNFERMLFKLPDSFLNSFWIRISAGPWSAWGARGTNYVSAISAIMGRKSVHFEIGSGLLLTYDPVEKKFDPIVRDRHLAGNAGFRYQKPGGHFIFRTGLGWPEGIYLCMGICF
jgi:hypothetical protein